MQVRSQARSSSSLLEEGPWERIWACTTDGIIKRARVPQPLPKPFPPPTNDTSGALFRNPNVSPYAVIVLEKIIVFFFSFLQVKVKIPTSLSDMHLAWKLK